MINDEHKVFLFSAGITTNIFVHDLWQYNKNNIYMDVGSAFDPFTGIERLEVITIYLRGKNENI